MYNIMREVTSTLPFILYFVFIPLISYSAASADLSESMTSGKTIENTVLFLIDMVVKCGQEAAGDVVIQEV